MSIVGCDCSIAVVTSKTAHPVIVGIALLSSLSVGFIVKGEQTCLMRAGSLGELTPYEYVLLHCVV